MANKLYEEASIQGIANAIRAKNGSADTYAAAEMAGAISAIESAGDSELSFNLVGGTTQPSSPAENTIWVNTDTDITGWVFSQGEPESPAEGLVWFKTGTSSAVPFNAVKRNGIWVCPSGCRQYVSGAWAAKTAQTYQAGAWVDWRTYLYCLGDECTALTGGWVGSGSIIMTKNTADMTYKAPDTAFHWIRTTDKVDLTDFDTLKGIISSTNTASAGGIGVKASVPVSSTNLTQCAAYATFLAGEEQELTVDISSLSGSFYIVSITNAAAYTRKMHRLWLE